MKREADHCIDTRLEDLERLGAIATFNASPEGVAGFMRSEAKVAAIRARLTRPFAGG